MGLLLLVSLASVWRFGQLSGYFPLASLTSLGAVALFGAAYFRSTAEAYAFPLLTLVVSDWWLSQTLYAEYTTTLGFFYTGWWWTYLAFALMVLWSRWVCTSFRVWRLAASSLGVAFIHWVVSDIGPCVASRGMMLASAQEWHMLFRCYLVAIPWSMRFLLGTLLYGTLLFGGFELLRAYLPFLSRQRA